MLVHVRVVGDVQWYHHLEAFHLVVEEGTLLGTFLGMLGVSDPGGVVTVNGEPALPGRQLAHGDEIVIQKRGERIGTVSD